MPPDPKAIAAEKGYGKVPLREALAGAGGQGPLPQGGPEYQALSSAYPELPARVAGQPYHWYEQQFPNPIGKYLGGPATLPLQDLLVSSGTGLSERIRSGLLGRVLPHQAESAEAQSLFNQPPPAQAPVGGPAGPIGPPAPPLAGPGLVPGASAAAKPRGPAVYRSGEELARPQIGLNQKRRTEDFRKVQTGR